MMRVLIFFILFSFNSFSKDFNFIELIKDQDIVLFEHGEKNIFAQLQNEYANTFQEIARQRADSVINNNPFGVDSGLNNVGISYSNEFSSFSVNFKRSIAPDILSDSRQLITDSLTITINASHLLGELESEGVINISEENLALFGGINFIRKYEIYHFANNYREALYKDFDKLFFPYRYFHTHNLKKLNSNELIQITDSLSLSVGAMASAPLVYSLSAGVAGMASVSKMSKVMVQSLDKRKLLSYEKEKSVAAGLTFKLQSDLLKILKLTLFSYEFNYELSESLKYNISLPNQVVNQLGNESELDFNIDRILKMRKPHLPVIEDFIISVEDKKKISKESKYGFLIFTGQKKSLTEHKILIKDGEERSFFNHNFIKERKKENVFSKLLNDLLVSLIDFGWFVKTDFVESKRLNVEYQNIKNLIKDKGEFDLREDNNNLSVNFIHEVLLNNTKSKKKRSYMSSYLKHYTGAKDVLIELVDKGVLKKSNLYSEFQIKESGLFHLNNLTVDDVYDSIEKVCKFKPKNRYYRNRSLFSFCKRSLHKRYQKYILERNHYDLTSKSYKSCKRKLAFTWSLRKKRALLKNCILKLSQKSNVERENQIPLWRLKDFLSTVHHHSRTRNDLYDLFGFDNVYHKGRFSAKSESGENYQSFFDSGKFQGRSPSSDFLDSKDYVFFQF